MAEEDEEKNEEEDGAERERYNRIKSKFNAFLADISEDMVPEEDRKKIEDKVKRVFTREQIPYSARYIVTFTEGMNFMMQASMHGQEVIAPLLATMQGVAAKQKMALKKKVDESMKLSGIQPTE